MLAPHGSEQPPISKERAGFARARSRESGYLDTEREQSFRSVSEAA